MKVIVLGSGVIGTTTAYFLARQGHEVHVHDRTPAPAMETSHANAGQISPGYSAPWAAPGIPLKAIKWMMQAHAPLSIGLDGSLAQLSWLWQMLCNCNAERYAVNKARMVRLAEYSRDCLQALRRESGIQYEGRQQGTLQVFRTQAQLDGVDKDIAILKAAGVPFELLNQTQLHQAEPFMDVSALVGGLRLPHDETGDCHLFTTRLAELAKGLGVQFHFGSTIEGLSIETGQVRSVTVDSQPLVADAYVVAMGSYSTAFLTRVLKIPVYPVKGYSITADIRPGAGAPVSTVLDETFKVAITRLDQRIRVGGMAELRGFDLSLKAKRQATLELCLHGLFPGAAAPGDLKFWTALRPMTPDGTPIVGATPVKGLYLNTGHGTLGWTMACGSGRLLSDIICGRTPEIAHQDLGVARYLGELAG